MPFGVDSHLVEGTHLVEDSLVVEVHNLVVVEVRSLVVDNRLVEVVGNLVEVLGIGHNLRGFVGLEGSRWVVGRSRGVLAYNQTWYVWSLK